MKKIIPLLFCTGAFTCALQAQDLAGIKNGFDQYSARTLQEKIYVHTDRSFYVAGEIIWFKIYYADAGLNSLLNLSKVAYVDVLDDKNNAVLQAKVKLDNGTGNGSLYIPVTQANGNFKLRAYTNWMKNFSPELYFEQQITILNTLISPDAPVKQIANADIQFFPEGGSLVNGVNSTVGFKATGTDGKGILVNGVVTDQRNDTVARFITSKFGMGHFSFTPVANKVYKAVMRLEDKGALIRQLPDAAAQGYVMQVSKVGAQQIQVKLSSSMAAGSDVYLMSHSGATVNAAQMVHLNASDAQTITLDETKMGDGINHITLFNANKEPVCERLYFKRPALLDLRTAVAAQFGLRKRVDVGIEASGNGKPQKANMSLSVYRLDSLNHADEGSIASYLWLTSELKGNIEMPGYYFTNANSSTDQELDNLLLTQGWSRFKWKEALDTKPAAFAFLPEYNGHLVTGKVTDRAGTPAVNLSVYMGVISKKPQFYGAVSNRRGQLLFNTRDLYSNNEVVLQTNTEIDTTGYRISLNSPFSEQYSASKLAPFYVSSAVTKQLEANSLGMQVQNLYKPENLRRFRPIKDSSAFYGDLYKPYLIEKYTRFITMEEVLREYVAEVNVRKDKQHYHIKTIGKGGSSYLEGDALVLIDGIPVFNMDKVFAVDPAKMRRIEVVNQRLYWGPSVSDGIVSYASYKTDMGGMELDPRAIVLDYEGMQLQREFYSPVYETLDQQKSRIPDFRNLLFWSPDINTGADGKAQASFYTSDKAGKYIGVIQGISSTGMAGSQYFTFEVR